MQLENINLTNGNKISPYVYAGLKQTIMFDTKRHRSNDEAYIIIHPKNGIIYLSKSAAYKMGISVGDKIHFLIFGEKIYVCKSIVNEGTKIFLRGKSLSTQTLLFADFSKKKLGAYNKFTCVIKYNKAEFNGNNLWELVLPYRYKRTFFINQNKLKGDI